jgi:hypothetical protein
VSLVRVRVSSLEKGLHLQAFLWVRGAGEWYLRSRLRQSESPWVLAGVPWKLVTTWLDWEVA